MVRRHERPRKSDYEKTVDGQNVLTKIRTVKCVYDIPSI